MYVDKLNSKVSEEMYKRQFNKLISEVNQKEKEYNDLKNKKEDDRQDDSQVDIVFNFKKLNNLI